MWPALTQISDWLRFASVAAEETEVHIRGGTPPQPSRFAYAYAWMLIAGAAKLFLGSDEEAVAWLRRSVEANRNNPTCTFLSRRRPGASRSAGGSAGCGPGWARPESHFYRASATKLVRRATIQSIWRSAERVSEGIRKAGVPEGDRESGRARGRPEVRAPPRRTNALC